MLKHLIMKIFSLNMKRNILPYLTLLLVVLITSCDRRSTDRGHSYLPDMQESQAYETYSENPNFSDSMTLRKPSEGTIPRGIIPYPLSKTDEDMVQAGKQFHNPLEYSNENLERGKLQYERFCAQCHGKKGDGQGFLYTSKKYTYPPANLLLEKTITRPDGEIYHIITVGIKIMGAHGSQLSQDDRWKILMYMRRDLQEVK